MIAASEPLEFIPRGRQAVLEHPGPLCSKQAVTTPVEHILLHRMQNVNISAKDDAGEFWLVREIYNECDETKNLSTKENDPKSGDCKNSIHMTNFYVNSEEELYVKGYTAVWSKGVSYNGSILPRTCFTCDTPIKFAFFCHEKFINCEEDNYQKKINSSNRNMTSICLIDGTSLKVYCESGEDYISNLEFPVSNVWQTKYGIMLEKEASNTVIDSQNISMPRFFSLSHPLNEMCPILMKTSSGHINYLTDADIKIIFSSSENDLVLIYDNKFGKHLISRLREVTEEEIYLVGCNRDMDHSGTQSHTSRLGLYNISYISSRFSGFGRNNASAFAKSGVGGSGGGYTTHVSKFLTSIGSPLVGSSSNTPGAKSSAQSPLNRLQSSLSSPSTSIQDMRKIGQSQPSKPIVPQCCLENVWMETNCETDFVEISSKAFMHTDLINHTYLCYLLPKTGKLNLIKLEKSISPNIEVFGITATLQAKDAVNLEKMKMIAVLGNCGSLILYTGPVLVAKVHVSSLLPNVTPKGSSFTSTFPKRSSLLPTVKTANETHFDEELHLLSPVHPLPPQFPNKMSNVCTNLRDPVGNRLTLVYAGGKMYRITLPLMNESHFITKCIFALRHVLKKDTFVHFIAKWYDTRNAPGSQDFSIEKEWEMFRYVLLELMGRSISSNENLSNNTSFEEPKKRKKNNDSEGTEDDWKYLEEFLTSEINRETVTTVSHSENAILSTETFIVIFCTFHLLYEEMKLDAIMRDYLRYLAELLYQLSVDTELNSFCLHYFLDFPYLIKFKNKRDTTKGNNSKIESKEFFGGTVPNIFKHIIDIMKNKQPHYQYPYIPNVNETSRNIIQLTSLICHGHTVIKNWFYVVDFVDTVSGNIPIQKNRIINTNVPLSEQVIQMLIHMNISRANIEQLPPAIHFMIAQALEYSRLSPPTGSSYQAYELLLRSELVSHVKGEQQKKNSETSSSSESGSNKENSLSPRVVPAPYVITQVDVNTPQDDNDGMENVDTKLLRLRFPDDLRVMEVRRLLNSSEPVLIDIEQLPGVSDHEFIEKQEKQLFSLCTRTMALPLGRGMFTLRTAMPTSTEALPIPKLCLTGKEPIKGATVEMQQIEFTPNMAVWPSFHNGVAAGLKISPNAQDIDSTWIVFNKPKGTTEISTEHAGFLMALGLNGHLKNLSFMSVYEYLVKCDEMTSVGLLLGISATHRGTMDNTTTKLLSVHIEALLPATALELDIPQNIQVASLMGIGLIYQGTAKRHIAEVLLQEIGRPPGPEMENSIDRESYALTAGLALGLVTLGQGESPPGLRDLQLPDTLHYYMVGGNKRQLTGSQKEKYKLPSFQVREGDTVNIDVTAPGATLALGLMFFRTGDTSVANWMRPPDTSYLLDLIRPDLLLLRMIARGLILWDKIDCTKEWLDSQFPSSLAFDLRHGPGDSSMDIDHEANAQAYCNIITGAVFCMGLKYAGTGHKIAFRTLRSTFKLFFNMGNYYVGKYAGKATVISCLIVILISLSLVVAGSGSIEVMRIIRCLRSKIGPSHPHFTYGAHMGIHIALGFLFLGAGRYTLSRSPGSIAALVCALFPKFPNLSNDNRYHLQAFRHLYVLAVEPRLFLPRDIDTGNLCLCQITCIEINTKEMKNFPAPCFLPELDSLKIVKINDPNYWPVSFERGRNWDQLINILKNSDCIDVKKRAGCLSHLEDPDRLKSLLAQTLTSEQYSCWKIEPKSLLAFSNDSRVTGFIEKFLELEDSKDVMSRDELRKSQLLIIVFYNSLIKDKMHALSIYLSFLDALDKINKSPTSYNIWQFKILDAFQNYNMDDILASKEILKSIQLQLSTLLMEDWKETYRIPLQEYLISHEPNIIREASTECLQKICAIITYYDLIPNFFSLITPLKITEKMNSIKLLNELKKLNCNIEPSLDMIADLLNID